MPNYNLFTATPSAGADADNQPVTLGTEFWVTEECWVTQIRWFRPYGSDTAIRQAAIFEKPEQRITDVFDLPLPAYSSWGAVDIPPLKLVPGKRYVVAVYHPAGRYAATGGYFNASSIVVGPITMPKTSADSPNGTYIYGTGLTYPTQTYNGASYYSDVTFTDEDPTPPPVDPEPEDPEEPVDPEPPVDPPVDPPEGIDVRVRTENGWDTLTVQAKYYSDTGWVDAQIRYF